MQSTTIGSNQAGQRLDKFLHKFLPNAGSGFLYKMLRKKNITLNGKKAEGAVLLKEGDTVSFFFSQETFEKFTGRAVRAENPGYSTEPDITGKTGQFTEPGASGKKRQSAEPGASGKTGQSTEPDITGKTGQFTNTEFFGKTRTSFLEYEKAYRLLWGIQVVYEDEHFLFLNKPAGILSQKAKPEDCSLNEWMVGYLLEKTPSLADELITFRPSICNRLDRNTSGIVLCGKSLAGLQFLNRYIKQRSLRKFYHTICLGELKEARQVQGYLTKDGKSNKVQVYALPEADVGPKASGKQQITVQKYMTEQLPNTVRGYKSGKGSASEQIPSSCQDYIETGYIPLDCKHGYTYLEVELITGKTHQIRAQLASMGHPLMGDFKYGEEKANRRIKQKYHLSHQLLHAYRIVFPEILSGVGVSLSQREFMAPEPENFVKIKTSLGLDS